MTLKLRDIQNLKNPDVLQVTFLQVELQKPSLTKSNDVYINCEFIIALILPT